MAARLAIGIGLVSALACAALAASPPAPPRPWPGVSQPERARVNWILKCQGCHRPDASGSPATAPALAGQVSRFTALPGGRAYLGRVPGVADAALGDAELAELLNWTLHSFDAANLGPDFRPYTARELHELRRAPLRTEAGKLRKAILAHQIQPD